MIRVQNPCFPLMLLVLLLTLVCGRGYAGEGGWAVTGYTAILTEDPLENVLTAQADYESDFQLFSLSLSKQLLTEAPNYDFEWEVQLVKHISGQDHYELNGLYAVRWYPLPWDGVVESNVAVGLGLSYASEIPEFENDNHGKEEQLLAYILIEAEFQPRRWGNWSWVIRSHHRSGAFGLFGGVQGASNSIGIGLKYRF